jgi:hypothetical protein
MRMRLLKHILQKILLIIPQYYISKLHSLLKEVLAYKKSKYEAVLLFNDSNLTEAVQFKANQLVIPSWPGEFGFEIRYALPRFEIVASDFVKVLSRRTSIYPKGCSIYDEKYFRKEKQLFDDFKVIRSACAAIPTNGSALEFKRKWKELFISCGYDNKFVGECVGLKSFNIDNSGFDFFSCYYLFKFPTYNPLENADESLVKIPVPYHIGIQFRNRPERPDGRNSLISETIEVGSKISNYFNLPIIFYGKDVSGSIHDDATNADFYVKDHYDQLAREMAVLTKCRIFIAPDSGWADFIAWLGIPMIMQADKYNSIQSYTRQGRQAILMKTVRENFELSIDKLSALI